jgi:hypothetical protein
MGLFGKTTLATGVAWALLLVTGLASAAAYRVFPVPVASPDHGVRVLRLNPHDATASPFGWHDTNGVAGAEFTTLQGNNVHVYLDRDANNAPDGAGPDGGAALVFDYDYAPTQAPADYFAALAANAFYWGNMAHDIFYRHGFDEAAGNFQANNYGRGGLGNDYLKMEVADGSATNNLNWNLAVDGTSPRLQMFIWTFTVPNREASFDASVMLYGYGKIVEGRLAGLNCAGNSENPSSGYADFFATLLTNDFHTMTASTTRGLGTYLMGQPVGGVGIRSHPYTFDLTVNPLTYTNTRTLPVPHGVGTVYASALWDLTWLMVQRHGASHDWFNGNGAENRMLRLVLRALERQPCNTGFVGARDALLVADTELYADVDRCLIWRAFARRGLGLSASQGSTATNSDNTAAFDLPPSCGQDLIFAANFGP